MPGQIITPRFLHDRGPGIACLVSRSTTQSIANATTTSIEYDTEEFDPFGMHDTSSNTDRITIPTGYDGIWIVTATFQFDTNAVGRRIAFLTKNAATSLAADERMTATGDHGMTITSLTKLVGGDYVRCQAYQSSTVSLVVSASGNRFGAVFLGRS